jgi:tetratricopeptide (TPR) repeat protein
MGLEMTGDRPLLGHGQDAFPVLFARYRDRPDLPGIGTAHIAPESAHNFFVDLAVGTGVLGLLAFLALVGAVLWHAGRRALATDDTQLRLGLIALGTGVVGYLAALFFGFSEAMTSWVFWLLLGAMVGLLARVKVAPQNEGSAPESGTLASAMAAVGLTLLGALALGWAATFTAADLAAGQAERAKNQFEMATAARLSGRAVTLNPLQKTYLFQEARMYEWGVAGFDRSETLRRAIELYETLLDRFEPKAFEVYQLAKAKRSLAQAEGRPFEDVIDDFERAKNLDPYNRVLRRFLITLYEREGFDQLAAGHRIVLYCWSRCD